MTRVVDAAVAREAGHAEADAVDTGEVLLHRVGGAIVSTRRARFAESSTLARSPRTPAFSATRRQSAQSWTR
eukprot:3012353-Rhodomonas_salina.1